MSNGMTGSRKGLKLGSRMVTSLLVPLAILHLIVHDASGHGALIEPPMRSVLWKYGFDAPINYNYTELYCGGFQKFLSNSGRCGVCGDPLHGPYENERGGKYDLGIIARSYPEGTNHIEVKVEITAHHRGYFEFKLCPNDEADITQECLDRYPLIVEEGLQQGDPMKFYPSDEKVVHHLKLSIPPGIQCERCVLQWTYKTGNRWGNDPDGKSCLGCGPQETFINCADISISGHGTITNTGIKSIDSLPISDQSSGIAQQKLDAENLQTMGLEFRGITPNKITPSIIYSEATQQHRNTIVLRHTTATDTRQSDYRLVLSQNDVTMRIIEGFTKKHIILIPKQIISTTIRPQSMADNSHMQTSILNTTLLRNTMPHSGPKGQSNDRQQQLQGPSNHNAHLSQLNQIYLENTVEGMALGRHQPHGIRIDLQAMLELASPKSRESHQRLSPLKRLNDSHQLSMNLQNAQNTPVKRERATLSALRSLHSAISNTIHREAINRNVMLTQSQQEINRKRDHNE